MGKFNPASRLREVSPSGLRELFDLGAKLRAQGKDVISLGIGDLDLPLPDLILKALTDAIENGKTHYSSNPGIPELRSLISQRFQETYGTDYSEDEVLVTCGALEGLFDTMMALIEPGDHVLVQDPTFGYFENQAKLAGAQVELVPLAADFSLDVSAFSEMITSRTKMIVINFPCNPTGSVTSRKSLQELVDLARDNGSVVLSDECYEFMRLDGKKHISTTEFAKDNVIVVNSFSKAFVMTGLRLGYVLAPKNLMNPILQIHQYNTACAATPVQFAAATALNNPDVMKDTIDSNLEILKRRKEAVMDSLCNIPGITLSYDPISAFYAFPNVSDTQMTGKEFSKWILEHCAVIVVPGSEFGKGFLDNVRVSYGSATEDRIREAGKRIAQLREKMDQ